MILQDDIGFAGSDGLPMFKRDTGNAEKLEVIPATLRQKSLKIQVVP